MADQDPNVVVDSDIPAYEFGPPKDNAGHMATKEDVARLEALIAQGGRARVDPGSLATDDDREIAAILEKLEKSPVSGFKDHNTYLTTNITKSVVGQMKELFQQEFGAMREQQMVGTFRDTVVNRLCVGLDDSAKGYVRDYLETYDLKGLQILAGHKPTLDMLRHGAENVNGKGTNRVTGSGGTSAGTGAPPANISNDQEADAQEMFKNLGRIKGMTIEKCREMVSGVGKDTGLFDPANVVALGEGR